MAPGDDDHRTLADIDERLDRENPGLALLMASSASRSSDPAWRPLVWLIAAVGAMFVVAVLMDNPVDAVLSAALTALASPALWLFGRRRRTSSSVARH